MIKPGRKTTADLTVIPAAPRGHRLASPPDLEPAAAKLFREIVASCPPSHFVASDQRLLAVYCSALLISQRAAQDPSQMQAWERATRLVAQLATKLRLCPSARSDPKTVARRALDQRAMSYYELVDAGLEDDD